MLTIRDSAATTLIVDPGIRALVDLRFQQVFSEVTYDPDEHGYFVIAEVDDTVEQLEKEIGLSILNDPWYESLEEHHACYEMLFITNDDGFGITLIIPKEEGIDAGLLAACQALAIPAKSI
ncbi:MAG: hypothetical protein WC100_20825 [Sterolibacterium sp.]